jgi:ubiquinone/menaquinone biosynthesis C-methylase UbiE
MNLSKLIDMQRESMDNYFLNRENSLIRDSWFREDTIDFWRHKRMYETISPLAMQFKNSKWLSIGDGRYGLDSFRLNKLFNINVHPTDISESMLKKAYEMGVIKEYGIENAEHLSFADNSFDIIFCKEAFHHFPRPILALYEMLRVAKDAIILIEPNDNPTFLPIKTKEYIIFAMKAILSKLSGRKIKPIIPDINLNKQIVFEESGNFVYSVSNLELNKIVHGLNLGGLAFFTFNDFYIEGCEFEKAEENNSMFNKIKDKIKKLDLEGFRGITTSVLFKTNVDESLKQKMEKQGYFFFQKNDNPYL